jgi:hypothetical protein
MRRRDFVAGLGSAAAVVWHMASEDSHELDDVRISHPTILTCFILLHAQARMITAMPMDNELDLVGHRCLMGSKGRGA